MFASRDGSDVGEVRGARLVVEDASQVGEARRRGAAMASRLGFEELQVGRLGIVVTELATNLVRHGRGGEVLLRPLGSDGLRGMEVLALDRGPGMRDVPEALADGFSTAGTPGRGLGAVERQSAAFDLWSRPGQGTVVMSRLYASPGAVPPRTSMRVGAVCVPHPGEPVPGDAWALESDEVWARLLLVDGLGHGSAAAEAAQDAVRLFRQAPRDILATLEDIHAGLRHTRGAAVAVAELDPVAHHVRYAGLGNISGAVVQGTLRRTLLSHAGIVGHRAGRMQEFVVPWPDGALLVMYSDGLQTNATLTVYEGLEGRHPALAAALLYRDFSRGRDDVTVVVADLRGAGA